MREGDFLEAPGVVRARAELLHLEAAPLGVASEGAVDVAGPDRGFVAAHALANLDDHVLAVGRVGRRERDAQLLLERVAPLLELGNELSQLSVAASGVEVFVDQTPLLRELVRAFELLQAPSGRGSLAVVVVDRRVGHPLLRLLVRAFELVDELFDVAGHRRLRLAL